MITTTHNEKQIKHASEWVADWYNKNREILKTVGISAMTIWNEYASTTSFPMGPKSFFYMINGINISGGTIEKIKRADGWYYVIMN